MERRRFLRRAIFLCLVVVIVCAAVLLGGCATTDTGRKAEAGGAADIGSTGLALANGAHEALLGAPAVGIKIALTKYGDTLPCPERREWHRTGAVVNWGFTGWNSGQLIAVTAGTGPAGVLVAGMIGAVGLSRWAARDFDDLPPCALPDRAWDEDPSCNIADCWSLDLWPSEIDQLEQYEWEHY